MKTKTLYISDLDGTLLASDGHISDRSRNILNKVIKDGAKVSIATSRNLFAFDQRVAGVDFSIPVILNTGGCIYNCQTRHYDVISDIPFDRVLQLKKILDENEIVPSTTEEFLKYHKFITEDPKAKYWTDEDLLESFIVDFQAQNMFITRAIKLANKEEKFALAAGVVELYGYNLQVIHNLAGDLGKSVADFHDEDEDNDN